MAADREVKKKRGLLERLSAQARLFSATLAIVILAAAYFLLIGPMLGSIGAGSPNDLRVLRGEAEVKERKLQESKDLIAAAAKLNRESKLKIDAALPSSAEIPALLAALDSMSGEAGLKINGADLSEQKEGLKGSPEIGVINVAMTLSGGDYLSFKRLLVSLEHSLRLMDTVAIAMNPRLASYTLNLRAYYQKKR